MVNFKKNNYYFLSVIYLLYIYSVNYKFLPLDSSKIIWLILCLFILVRVLIELNKGVVNISLLRKYYPFFLYVALFIIVLFCSLFNGANNFTIPYYLIIYVIDYIPCAILISYFCFKYNINVVDLIVRVGVIQALLIFLMLLIPSFKEMYGGIVSISGNILDYYSYRGVGVTGFANYTVGTTQAMILCIYVLDLFKRERFKFLDLIRIGIIFFSALFSSRSSIVVLLLFLSFILIFLIDKKYFWKKIVPLIFLIVLFFSISIFYLISNQQVIDNNFIIKWALEPVINYINFGELATKSSDTISTFYFIPEYKTLFFGDWLYVNSDGTYYKSVDAGYMRILLYMGLPLSIFLYTTFTLSFLIFSLNLKFKLDRVFTIFFIFTIFVLNYKGNAFIDASAMFKLYFLYFTSILYENYKNVT
ncbi:hypothetical protein [Aliivibrio fischeri]|uniref:hypothetical protein n=1 Tax=Aliivibrio fischeri TaxID=668 RepID=UPI0012DA2ED5|nr:hypothetical protein [Aliivibrio fischeri]MUK65333.1 hypothetical protein [Aliivibrio fischeri]